MASRKPPRLGVLSTTAGNRNHDMDREDEEEMDIYANVDRINSSDVRTETENSDTNGHQTPQHTDGWIYYKSSLYFLSSEMKIWNDSRRFCTDRGADLTIINNSEEQGFVQKISADAKVWIGLTYRNVNGTWRWVDGSTLTSGFWASGEPNGKTAENCALNRGAGLADYPCSNAFQWICEKVILK